MPYRDSTASRLAARERKRRQRAKARSTTVVAFPTSTDPVGALANWSHHHLRVPPGHPLAGQPMACYPITRSISSGLAGVHMNPPYPWVAKMPNLRSARCSRSDT